MYAILFFTSLPGEFDTAILLCTCKSFFFYINFVLTITKKKTIQLFVFIYIECSTSNCVSWNEMGSFKFCYVFQITFQKKT